MFPSIENPVLEHIDQKMSELHPLARRAIFRGLPGAADFGAGVGGPAVSGAVPAGDAQPEPIRPIAGPMPFARSLTPTESPERPSSVMDPGSNRQRLSAEMRAAPQPGAPLAPIAGPAQPARGLGPAPEPASVATPAPNTLAAPAKVARPIAPLESPEQEANLKELHRLQTSPSGISQIGGEHPGFGSKVLRGLGHTAEAVGAMFGPTRLAEAFIPGTQLHHNMLEQQAEHRVNEGETVENEQQKRRLEAAQAHKAEQGEPPHTITTDQGIMQFNPETGKFDIPAGKAPVKEELSGKTIETDQGIMQWNPETQRYDIPAGKPPLKESSNIHVLPSGQVVAVHSDPKTGKSTAEVVYEGKPGEKPKAIPLQINGESHQVLIDESTGNVIKDLGKTGEKPPTVNINAQNNERDREAARFAKPHEAALTAANSQLEKIADARAMINGNAEAQATGIPKVLTALVSGQGSGVRITQAELNAIGKARGLAGDVEGTIRKWSGKGQLTPEQQRQLTQMLDDVAARIQKKQAIVNDTLDKINSAPSREEIVRIDKEARKQLQELEKGEQAGGTGDMINVQIPGHEPGQIHSSQKDRFLKDNPGAKVL